MDTVRVRIDRKRTKQLLEGKSVGVKIPAGAKVLEFRLSDEMIASLNGTSNQNPIAKIFDVFFNGRPA